MCVPLIYLCIGESSCCWTRGYYSGLFEPSRTDWLPLVLLFGGVYAANRWVSVLTLHFYYPHPAYIQPTPSSSSVLHLWRVSKAAMARPAWVRPNLCADCHSAAPAFSYHYPLSSTYCAPLSASSCGPPRAPSGGSLT